jgi:hypothetical protein
MSYREGATGMQTGFGQRGSISVRLRDGVYQPPLAHRALNHDWPEVIQRLWYSCNSAESTYLELADAAMRDRMNAVRISELEQMAWQLWQEMERYAAPIVAAVERQAQR